MIASKNINHCSTGNHIQIYPSQKKKKKERKKERKEERKKR